MLKFRLILVTFIVFNFFCVLYAVFFRRVNYFVLIYDCRLLL